MDFSSIKRLNGDMFHHRYSGDIYIVKKTFLHVEKFIYKTRKFNYHLVYINLVIKQYNENQIINKKPDILISFFKIPDQPEI